MTERDTTPDHDSHAGPVAKTDEPYTERYLGRTGIRIVHLLTYTAVFLLTGLVAVSVFAAIATATTLLLDVSLLSTPVFDSGTPVTDVQSLLDGLFAQRLFHPVVVGLAASVALVVTAIIFYWNESRYNRGEWIRTYL